MVGTLFGEPQKRPVEEWPNTLYMISDIPKNTENLSPGELVATVIRNALTRNAENARQYTERGTGQHSSNQYFTGKLSEVKPHIETTLNRFNKIFNTNENIKYVMLVFKVPNDITIKTDKVYGQRIKSVNPDVIQPDYLEQVYYLED